jgi:hypothetical protein
MANIDRFSERLVDMAERFADVTDAVQGRGNRRGGMVSARWVVLPLAGAGLYALGASGSFMRQAKNVVNQAKELASDLPDDLMGRVHDATGKTRTNSQSSSSSSGRQRSSASRSRSTTKRTSSPRRRKTTTSSAR